MNSDARVDHGGLMTLDEAGILSIDLAYSESDVIDIHGNHYRQVSLVTKTDGITVDIADVWFARDITDTETGERVEESDEIAFLPEIRGFGTVHSLRQAMVRDVSGQLQGLVESFAAEQDDTGRRGLVPAIIEEWTGGTDIISVLEAFTGKPYTGRLDGHVIPFIETAYGKKTNTVYNTLMAQTHYQYLYDLFEPDTTSDNLIRFDITYAAEEILRAIETDTNSGERLLIGFTENMYALAILDCTNYDEYIGIFAAGGARYGIIAETAANNIYCAAPSDNDIDASVAGGVYGRDERR